MKLPNNGRRDTWAIACTVRSHLTLVNNFLDYYLGLGCNEINLFFDDPNHVTLDKKYKDHPHTNIYVCDAEYWNNLTLEYPSNSSKDSRPSNIEARQCRNYQKVNRETKCQWVLHIDIDEYIIPYGQISSILSNVPNNIFALGARVLEAMYVSPPKIEEINSTIYFKSEIWNDKKQVESIFDEELLPLETGFWGHTLGKGFCRAGVILKKLSCHFSIPMDSTYITRFYSPNLELLHFEAMDIESFIDKRLGRLSKKYNASAISETQKKRLLHIKKVYEREHESGLKKLYFKMNILKSEQISRLKESGFIVERELDKEKPPRNPYILMTEKDEIVYSSQDIGPISVRHNVTKNYVYCEPEPGWEGKALLYTIVQGERNYIFIDAQGKLATGSQKNAKLYNCHRRKNGEILFSICDHYLATRPDGFIYISSNKRDNGTIFKLHHI